MNEGSNPFGQNRNNPGSEDPYGSLIGNPVTDLFNSEYYQILGSNGHLEIKDQSPFDRRNTSLYDQSFDIGLEKGRWRRAYARAINLSPNAPSFDIYLDGRLFYGGLAYRMQTDYISLRPGNHRILVLIAGQSRNPVFFKTIFVPIRSIISFVVCGQYAHLDIKAIDDRTAIPSGMVRVKVVHLSENTPAIDLIDDWSVWFCQVMYQEASENMTAIACRESLSVRLSGTQQTLLTVPNVQFVRNRAYTIYLTGLLSGSPPLRLLVTTDGCGRFQSE